MGMGLHEESNLLMIPTCESLTVRSLLQWAYALNQQTALQSKAACIQVIETEFLTLICILVQWWTSFQTGELGTHQISTLRLCILLVVVSFPRVILLCRHEIGDMYGIELGGSRLRVVHTQLPKEVHGVVSSPTPLMPIGLIYPLCPMFAIHPTSQFTEADFLILLLYCQDTVSASETTVPEDKKTCSAEALFDWIAMQVIDFARSAGRQAAASVFIRGSLRLFFTPSHSFKISDLDP